MSIAKTMKLSTIAVFCFVLALLFIMYMMISAVYEYIDIENKRYIQIELAAELRNSSRILTENFRLYIMTGDDKYNTEYWNMVKERSGMLPRSNNKVISPGEKIKLTTLLQQKISYNKLPIIESALRLSDELVIFEKNTMDMVSGALNKKQDIVKAKELAYSVYYISKTNEIMTLLDAFYNEVNNTSKMFVENLKIKLLNYVSLFTIIFLIFIILIVLFFIYSHICICIPIDRITHFVNGIIVEKSVQPIEINANNEIGNLYFALNLMLSRLQDEIVKSSTDHMTHLYNRSVFEKSIEKLRMQTQRHELQCFSILMLDLDLFKRVNDRFGHLCGDDVLRHFAEVMQKCCRKGDIIARLGGEEFAILLPQPPCEAAILAERIRSAMEKAAILPDGSSVTCSIGITQYVPGERGEELLGRADQALYRAKAEGRNRVCLL